MNYTRTLCYLLTKARTTHHNQQLPTHLAFECLQDQPVQQTAREPHRLVGRRRNQTVTLTYLGVLCASCCVTTRARRKLESKTDMLGTDAEQQWATMRTR